METPRLPRQRRIGRVFFLVFLIGFIRCGGRRMSLYCPSDVVGVVFAVVVVVVCVPW